MPNYKKVAELLAQKLPFKHGHSMKAVFDNYGNGDYVVYSYTTIIARYNTETGWWINLQKYSVTTSKQQNLLKRVAQAEGWLDPEGQIL